MRFTVRTCVGDINGGGSSCCSFIDIHWGGRCINTTLIIPLSAEELSSPTTETLSPRVSEAEQFQRLVWELRVGATVVENANDGWPEVIVLSGERAKAYIDATTRGGVDTKIICPGVPISMDCVSGVVKTMVDKDGVVEMRPRQ